MTIAKSVLIAISAILSVAMYVPLWRRIWSRRETADFSKGYYIILVINQLSTLAVAGLSQSWFLLGYYILQLVIIAYTMRLIWRYYD